MEEARVKARLLSQQDLEKRRFDQLIQPLISMIEAAKTATKPLDIGFCRFCLDDVSPPFYEATERKFICGKCRDIARACETEEQKKNFAAFIYVRNAANLIENSNEFGCENHFAPTYCTDCCTLLAKRHYSGRLTAPGISAHICKECALDVEAQKSMDVANTNKQFIFRPHDVSAYLESIAGSAN